MSRKNRNQEKKLRRELEILRAELRSRNNGDQEVVQSPNITDLTNSIPSQSSNKKNSFNFDLSVGTIKKDLLKTIFFAVFALFVIVALKMRGI
ncbi:hypothetical protein A3F07_00460 [candidate division WWE3 bacterium RIFCSPHIGHO2_12_FULL_38_15]|uniref:Uncharacterized protein n=1 Tax=candidate division WWE3 bacterium RIFCSPHIGHO2_02_FULL_38_14 TaxID=1802620 RepID=A0A1F4VB25_UNCKA|nr:MAG: hypothetical protein A2793_00550 [candidate division WWE3 bacterium RIFCSPHIGHO2_01_FULL_38_45]OGC49047.1 MAG: hypothetical protein A3F07_00460 [candidate division WWE3 bacterium RIFCSPHIGHO2_12_FULL_38_15]OGC53502.1 MAG: hypothetical protein A3B64_04095 [candidate division WWE3 bacterium RIFCSPLOWO2_01_FULL_37_24]OGC54406.1 MAG: hypothetical protein A3D91_00725 [candidate division WWE3 bacterium RIFCSPHIGHO2_02_FULL_38_14]HLB51650.1 hypothetical protein [Patescibacteria group bacterium